MNPSSRTSQEEPTVIPNELPPSRMVYVLTTSEGRDKLFKLLQYILLTSVYILQQDKIFPYNNMSRDYWIRRFTSNLSTLRFGRCLFRLGRWLISIVYLQMSIRYLMQLLKARRKPIGAPSRLYVVLALVMVIRCCASVARSVVRDIMFLSDTGFVRSLRLSPEIYAFGERAQLLLWVVVSLADCVLIEWRLSLTGWVPDLRQLRCECDAATAYPVGAARFEYTPKDLDYGAPYPLTVSYFGAMDPADMPVLCTKCNQMATLELLYGHQKNESNMSGVLFVPNMLRRMFEVFTVVGAHGNFREMLILRLKCFSELILSFTLAYRNFKAVRTWDTSGTGALPRVSLTLSLAGLLSALISLHRVWAAAK